MAKIDFKSVLYSRLRVCGGDAMNRFARRHSSARLGPWFVFAVALAVPSSATAQHVELDESVAADLTGSEFSGRAHMTGVLMTEDSTATLTFSVDYTDLFGVNDVRIPCDSCAGPRDQNIWPDNEWLPQLPVPEDRGAFAGTWMWQDQEALPPLEIAATLGEGIVYFQIDTQQDGVIRGRLRRVPEPGTFPVLLLGAGVSLLGLRRRRI